MATRLSDGMSRLSARMKACEGVTITYRRGGYSVSLTATLGQSLQRISDDRGNVKTARTDRDFIITAADLIINGSVTLPESGDKVDYDGERFEVSPVDKGTVWNKLDPAESPFRYTDPSSYGIRIHTRRIGDIPS